MKTSCCLSIFESRRKEWTNVTETLHTTDWNTHQNHCRFDFSHRFKMPWLPKCLIYTTNSSQILQYEHRSNLVGRRGNFKINISVWGSNARTSPIPYCTVTCFTSNNTTYPETITTPGLFTLEVVPNNFK